MNAERTILDALGSFYPDLFEPTGPEIAAMAFSVALVVIWVVCMARACLDMARVRTGLLLTSLCCVLLVPLAVLPVARHEQARKVRKAVERLSHDEDNLKVLRLVFATTGPWSEMPEPGTPYGDVIDLMEREEEDR